MRWLWIAIAVIIGVAATGFLVASKRQAPKKSASSLTVTYSSKEQARSNASDKETGSTDQVTPSPTAKSAASATPSPSPTGSSDPTFGNPKKSAHYVSSTPAHGETLTAVPAEVKLDFNFDLGANSTISIKNNNQEYGEGDVTYSADKRSMQRSVDITGPEGIYTVNYNACWPDGSCHDGNFKFLVKGQ